MIFTDWSQCSEIISVQWHGWARGSAFGL